MQCGRVAQDLADLFAPTCPRSVADVLPGLTGPALRTLLCDPDPAAQPRAPARTLRRRTCRLELEFEHAS